MADVLTRPEPQTEDKEINQIWAEIEALNEQMRQDQIIIEDLKTETQCLQVGIRVS